MSDSCSLFILTGEVRCLCTELEAEKSKFKQEKEETAQQLLQAEQKYQEMLDHCQIVHKEEVNTLRQELVSNHMGSSLIHDIIFFFGGEWEIEQKIELIKWLKMPDDHQDLLFHSTLY